MGGLAVRALCEAFPPRERDRQDLDFASTSQARRAVTTFLVARGCSPDEHFNRIHGHKQLFFGSPRGRAIDVVIDRLEMCHVVDFRDRIDRMPLTLDVTDLLLSKLQIVELNAKDVHDLLHLLSGFEVRPGDEPASIGLDRIGRIVADDWGWWRTVTMNLDKLAALADGEHADLVPEARRYEPAEQARALRGCCEEVPKPLRWKIRAKVGDRVQWYQLPEEVGH
jgi:hypothetical protein